MDHQLPFWHTGTSKYSSWKGCSRALAQSSWVPCPRPPSEVVTEPEADRAGPGPQLKTATGSALCLGSMGSNERMIVAK